MQKRAQGSSWQQAMYTEQMARIPHSTYKETHERHKEQERRVGPGAYSINDFIAESERKPRCIRGALDQLTPRFPVDLPVGVIRSFLSSVFLDNRNEHHHPVLMVFPMRNSLKHVGNKAVIFLHSNGVKDQEHYH